MRNYYEMTVDQAIEEQKDLAMIATLARSVMSEASDPEQWEQARKDLEMALIEMAVIQDTLGIAA